MEHSCTEISTSELDGDTSYDAENSFLFGECDVEHGSGYERLIVKQNICYIVAGKY